MYSSGNKFSKADWAHFWIPFVVIIILSVVVIFVSPEVGVIKWLYISTIFVLLILQTFNELLQYYDKDRDKKYGGRNEFLKNSKKDWALFILALFSGSILFFLIIVFYI